LGKTWHSVNDLYFAKTPDKGKAKAQEADDEPKKKNDDPEVRLSDGKFVAGVEGFQFNKKCKVKVKVDYLKKTNRKKVTFKLFVVYNNKEEDLAHQAEGYEDKGVAEAEVTLFYGDAYSKALQKDPAAKCSYKFKASHTKGEKEIESELLEMPYEKKLAVDFIEIVDEHFHHNCALPCLDEKGDLIASLQTAFSYIKNNPDRELVIQGHADRSGDEDYNLRISKRRAEAIKALLGNDGNVWKGVVESDGKDQKIETEDYQQTLKALSSKYGWPCDPGAVDNKYGQKTEAAAKNFQSEYNKRFPKNEQLTVDGKIGPKSWIAIFHVLRDILDKALKSANLDPPPSLNYGYPDGKGVYPCGESSPVTGLEKSEKDRRVELVFYRKGECAPVIAPASGRKVEQKKDPVTEKEWEKTPVNVSIPLIISFNLKASEIYPVWDIIIEDRLKECIAIFDLNKETAYTISGAVCDDSGKECKELPAAQEQKTRYKVIWDGLDSAGNLASCGKYKIKLFVKDKNTVVAESESSLIKIIRIGVTEISFKETIPCKFYDYVKESNTWKKINFDIPDIHWKIESLNDTSNKTPRTEPVSSNENQSSDAKNYSYPICYIKGEKLKCSVTMAGSNYEKADNIRIIVVEATKFESKNNENIDPGMSVELSATDKNNLPSEITMLSEYILDFVFEYKNQEGVWKKIGIQKNKNHIVFTILDKPVEPWGDGSAPEKCRPWVSVLKRLCGNWAKGQTDKDSAASLMVEKAFKSGFKYDTTQGASFYTTGTNQMYVELLMWNNKLDNKPDRGELVNCTDCASIVTSLANMVGCELYSSRFDNSQGGGFWCHKVISIGVPGWKYPFEDHYGGTKGGFSYHEIGWKGSCSETDDIFDACLKVALDPDTKPAQDDIFASDMGYSKYEPKLVISIDRSDVKPDQSKRIRRQVK